MSKALVVYSGGQDSTTCLFWAKKKFDQVWAIAYNYGQRHVVELDAAKRMAAIAEVPLRIFEIDLLSSISHNSLTDPGMEVDQEQSGQTPPNTLVEGRNMLFLTYAAIYAKANEFILSLNQSLNLSMAYDYRIHTPLMWLDKAAIWKMADELGVFELVKDHTITCYHGIAGEGCGQCPSCRLRNRGLINYLKSKSDGTTE